jgi:hypothetical protein
MGWGDREGRGRYILIQKGPRKWSGWELSMAIPLSESAGCTRKAAKLISIVHFVSSTSPDFFYKWSEAADQKWINERAAEQARSSRADVRDLFMERLSEAADFTSEGSNQLQQLVKSRAGQV